jgi:hypothetical protein
MGSGQVRLRADPSVPETPRAADWLEGRETEWDVGPGSLALHGSIGELQNVAVLCSPAQRRVELGRLPEYRAAVVVSSRHAVLPPCIAVPDLQTAVSGGTIMLVPSLQPSGSRLSVTWRIDGRGPDAVHAGARTATCCGSRPSGR